MGGELAPAPDRQARSVATQAGGQQLMRIFVAHLSTHPTTMSASFRASIAR